MDTVTNTPTIRKALWVEVRDSETGQRIVEQYEAPIPKTRTEREAFLNKVVPQIFPGAELRTYGGGVATFVRDMLLIEAHYGAVRDGAELSPLPDRPVQPVFEDEDQGRLFAA